MLVVKGKWDISAWVSTTFGVIKDPDKRQGKGNEG